MEKQRLTIEAFNDLKHMLNDEMVAQAMFMMEKNIAKHKVINADGSVTLGKTKYSWWNRVWNDEKIISVDEVCNRLIEIMTGVKGTRNEDAFFDLHRENAEALSRKDYSWIISRIFVAYRFYYRKDISPENVPASDGRSYKRVSGALATDAAGGLVYIPLNLR